MAEVERRAVAGRRDLTLYLLLLTLALGGLLILYPASSVLSFKGYQDSTHIIQLQLGWFAIGMVFFFLTASLPLELFRRLSLPLLALVTVLLILVFVPGIGHSVGGGSRGSFQRWIGIGNFTFQPSELAKFAIILFLADRLAKIEYQGENYDLRKLITPLAMVGVVLTLIVLEPQFGTTLCIVAVIVTLIFISGFPVAHLVTLFLSSIPLILLLVWLVPYRKERFLIWLDPFSYKLQGGYQIITAYRALREGGFFGEELAGGFAHRYLTYGHTDFVLALFGEDYGFLGMILLFALYLAICWRMFSLLKGVKDSFYFLLASGALLMLIFQSLLNMMVVTGLVPTTGVSLPFISYGGSSLTVSLALSGLLLNISRYSVREVKLPPEPEVTESELTEEGG